MNPRLNTDEIARRLESIPSWSLRDGKIQRELKFGRFDQAFGFMNALALIAARMNHHPEFFNVYDRVTLALWTHDAGGLTVLDFELAEAAEKLLPAFSA
ncbi:MAG TPA: 4a-hydroxytetrahydrobiopterin dehydratase [Polyangiales bacterium]|nr:4a-hydroxytetrahydrobiopterin dehydratase [Polyangiales bacterium]